MSYKSPISIFYDDDFMLKVASQLQEHNEMHIMAQINQYVSVDKEELIKALNYDRQQYEKGYQEGHIDGVLQAEKLYARPQGEWILNKDENPECPFCHHSFTYWGNFCGNCGAAMTHQEVQE